jgi:hypothetical protein
VVHEILEDIFDYFTEQMRLPQRQPKQMDLTLDFEKMPLFPTQENLPTEMAIGESRNKSP